MSCLYVEKKLRGRKGVKFEDDEISTCHVCKHVCQDPIKCTGCGKINFVYYHQDYDFFFCERCYYKAETEKDRRHSNARKRY